MYHLIRYKIENHYPSGGFIHLNSEFIWEIAKEKALDALSELEDATVHLPDYMIIEDGRLNPAYGQYLVNMRINSPILIDHLEEIDSLLVANNLGYLRIYEYSNLADLIKEHYEEITGLPDKKLVNIVNGYLMEHEELPKLISEYWL